MVMDDQFVVVRWLVCDEYHSHSKERGCFSPEAKKWASYLNPKSILSIHETMAEAEQAAEAAKEGTSK